MIRQSLFNPRLPVYALLAWSRVRKILLGVVFLAYGASILGWLVYHAAGLYLPPRWSGGFFGFIGIFIFGFAILVWALTSWPLWPRWRIAGPALLLGALALWVDVGPVTRWSNERFLREPELNAFAAWLHGYGRISEMREWGSEGITHSLNGTVVRTTREELDSVSLLWRGDGKPALLRDVLARDGIDPAVYEDVRRQLRRFHLGSFSVHGDYVAFRQHRDGGLVYAVEGAPPLERGEVVPGTAFEVGRPMGRWYFFWCCVRPDSGGEERGAEEG